MARASATISATNQQRLQGKPAASTRMTVAIPPSPASTVKDPPSPASSVNASPPPAKLAATASEFALGGAV